MQADDFEQSGLKLTRDALAAAENLKRMPAEREREFAQTPRYVPGKRGAINGLAVAIPLSLSFWLAIGVLVWMMHR